MLKWHLERRKIGESRLDLYLKQHPTRVELKMQVENCDTCFKQRLHLPRVLMPLSLSINAASLGDLEIGFRSAKRAECRGAAQPQ
jgi:hypothetical protein